MNNVHKRKIFRFFSLRHVYIFWQGYFNLTYKIQTTSRKKLQIVKQNHFDKILLSLF